MTEAALLSLGGGLLGLALAAWAGETMYRVLLPDVELAASIVAPRVLVFLAIAFGLTSLLAGVLPAIQSSGHDLLTSLKSGGERAGTTRTRTQASLLVVQVALSVVLLAGASVFSRSLSNLRAVDLGFEDDGLFLVDLNIDGAIEGLGGSGMGGDEPAWPPNEVARIYELAEERLSELPGVRGAALVNPTPFYFALTIDFHVPGLDSIPSPPSGGPYPLEVSADYFDVMALEVLSGRGFRPEDDSFGAEPVTVLNETMAGLLWPGEPALGRCVMPGGDDHPCATIIGIVEDSHRQAVIEDDPQMIYYVPMRQQILGGAPTNIFVSASGANAASLRVAAQSASRQIRFARVDPFSYVTGYELRPWTLGAAVFSAFGLLALLVAAFGLYAVFAFDVAGRVRELGIRSALGATRRRLLTLVLSDGLRFALLGVLAGTAGALALSRYIRGLLFGVSSHDPVTLASVALALLLVATAACLVPAWRAARADPVTTLKGG
jgi:predicted permease